MPTCEPIDESFFATAPQRWERSWTVPMSAEAFWPDFVARPLHWCRGLRIRWTSERPYAVGTTRHVGILGALQADELFFLWEEGHRMAFHFTRTNLPAFTAFGEYYQLDPIDEASCRFTWRLAAAPTLLGSLSAPGNKVLIASLFRDTTRYLDSLR
ncbi:MAG: hypothetical protein QM572_08500 [Nocardioides sp.]|uniref:hypothetical protein n=1 Tax=Nocardioides sp. TaxID=35761 RepID=UPI0039E63516